MSKWKIDPTHSAIEFSVKHLGVSWVRGRFNKLAGTLAINEDNPAQSSAEGAVELASVWTGDEGRDKHLLSKDFFDAESYPQAVFKSAKVEKTGEKRYRVTGDLTIRGITKLVIWEVELLGMRQTPTPDGGSKTVAGLLAKTKINRHDFQISWDAPAGEGATTVGGEVELAANLEAVKE